MGAKQDLDVFDREWAEHLRWREGTDRGYPGRIEPPGKYVEADASGVTPLVRLVKMPRAVRDAVMKELGELIRDCVTKRAMAERVQLVAAAIDEAKETIRSLSILNEGAALGTKPAEPEESVPE